MDSGKTEYLIRSVLAKTAITEKQQALFLPLHVRDAILRFFQTLPLATRKKLELPKTAYRHQFSNPQTQKLFVFEHETMKIDTGNAPRLGHTFCSRRPFF